MKATDFQVIYVGKIKNAEVGPISILGDLYTSSDDAQFSNGVSLSWLNSTLDVESRKKVLEYSNKLEFERYYLIEKDTNAILGLSVDFLSGEGSAVVVTNGKVNEVEFDVDTDLLIEVAMGGDKIERDAVFNRFMYEMARKEDVPRYDIYTQTMNRDRLIEAIVFRGKFKQLLHEQSETEIAGVKVHKAEQVIGYIEKHIVG